MSDTYTVYRRPPVGPEVVLVEGVGIREAQAALREAGDRMARDEPEVRHCRACHSVYFVRPDEAEFFLKKGLAVPSHCPTCRKERRLAKERERA